MELSTFTVELKSTGGAQVAAEIEKVGSAAERAARPVDRLLEEIRQTRTRADELVLASRGLATTTAATGTAAGMTSRQMGTLGRSMAAATANALGLNSNVTRLLGGVAAMAAGGGVIIAATAGIAALGSAWRAYGADAREAKERTDALITSLVRAYRERTGLADIEREQDLLNRLSSLRRQAADARRVAAQFSGLDPSAFGTDPGLQRQIAEVNQALTEFYSQRNTKIARLNEDLATNNRRTFEGMVRDQERALEEEQRILRMRREIYESILGPPATRRGPDGRFQVPTTWSQAAAGRARLEEAATLQAEADRINALFRGTADVMAAVAPQQERYNRAAADTLAEHLRAVDAQERMRFAIVDMVAALDVVPGSVLRVADAAIALSAASQRPGFTGRDAALGGLGLAVGVVGGIFGELSADAAEARRYREELARAREAYGEEMARFTALFTDVGPLRRGIDELEDMAERLLDQFREMNPAVRPATVAGLTPENAPARLAAIEAAMAGASRARRHQLEQEAAVIKEWLQVHELTLAARERQAEEFRRDLDERELAATGREAELDAMRLANRHRLEALDAERAGLDALTRARLAEIQALERTALETRLAQEELDRLFRQGENARSIDERERRLAGDDLGADVIAAEARANREREAARRELAAGNLTEADFLRLLAVIEGELDRAIHNLRTSASEAAQALDRLRRSQVDDLEIRLLLAQGLDAEAEARRLQLRMQEEMAEAVDDEVRALIELVYAAEATARAAQKAADEVRAYQEALRAQADFVAGLRERELRATGLGDAADEFAQLERFRREMEAAIAAGRTDAELAELRRVQELERAAADEARRRRQDEAFAQATATSVGEVADSRTSVNLAVGISETTGNRLAGLMTAQLVYQRHLTHLTQLPVLVEEVRALRRGGSPGIAFNPSAVDEALAAATADADADRGYLPGMRN